MADASAQEHPISIYFVVWGALFVLSAFSYMVDYLQIQGYMRWILILIFMWLKAGGIVAVFMHMRWERPALISAILGPPVVLFLLVGFMAVEGDFTSLTRVMFFGESNFFDAVAGSGH
jgi:cytochrome c oxidase subunit 4